MEPPFPGMDPYLEEPSLWPDVHHRLITAICDQLQILVVPRYRAVITPYVVIESLESAPNRMVVPDVGIFEQDMTDLGGGLAVAIAQAPLTLPALIEVPTEYARIEIRSMRDNSLVTVIELLSPANKRPSTNGADAYEQKRREIMQSTANLLEIDLLRGGRRSRVSSNELPAAPYFIFLSRAKNRFSVDVWPLALRQPIARVPVPLRHPDPDVPLDLGAALRDCYRRARYDVQVDSLQPPPLPELSAEEGAWLAAHLRERGLRP